MVGATGEQRGGSAMGEVVAVVGGRQLVAVGMRLVATVAGTVIVVGSIGVIGQCIAFATGAEAWEQVGSGST